MSLSKPKCFQVDGALGHSKMASKEVRVEFLSLIINIVLVLFTLI